MSCKLCGLDSSVHEFCCAGCENVYAILMESGVIASGQDFRDTEIYRESLRLGLISNRSAEAPDIPENVETREAVFHVAGMWCTSCGWLIEHALARLRGVRSAEVLFASDLLKVRYAPQYLPLERILERVASLGYRATEYQGPGGRTDAERKNLLLRTGIAAFLWMNAMMFSLVIYASYFERITGFGRHVPFVLMAIATPAVFYCAAPVLRIAWAGVRTRALRMEALLAMGILAAYGYSVVVAFQGGMHVYFDTACAIVTLVLTGKLIERAAKERTTRALALLCRLMPNKARVVVDGRERFVSVDALKPGTVFRVKAGERIPADGEVVEGRSHADESVLTGESVPRPKGPGDFVVCGSLNTGSVLEVRTIRAGVDSTLAHIIRTVEQAAARRSKTERAVDSVSRLFIPAVFAIAVLTFAGWTWRTGSPAAAMMHAIAVVVIACPCALGIATPLALSAAVSAAGKRGVLVADTRVLETICAVDVVVLDKTGTATAGEFTLLEAVGDTSRMAELAAVEASSEHPIGRALGSTSLTATDVAVHKGLGIAGTVNGIRYFLGNRQFTAPAGNCSFHLTRGTTVYFGWGETIRGAMAFGDRIRPEAAALCGVLRNRGIRTIMLSGDCPATTEETAREIGVETWVAEAAPDRKIEIIRELQGSGSVVAMIGDGVNDAPSLAQADLGIALGAGADIAVYAAPLVLMNNSLTSVIATLDLARRTFRIVRQNLFWAFAYNTIGITLAIVGALSPIMAAGAMVLSSLSVIGNSRRLN
ncbi:MAG TPA: copper-translocating P-type ATPase [Bryobacteraceae bacterium]|nr:copper-translocating P-type ATPase [Bryobacteraceae bacterium]